MIIEPEHHPSLVFAQLGDQTNILDGLEKKKIRGDAKNV
jgi:hypothetical protein